MEYPATVIIDKTAQEIAQASVSIGQKHGLSPDVLCLAFEKAYTVVIQQKIAALEDIIVGVVNETNKEGSEDGEH